MKILVTGGAGFIGSNFLHRMVSKYPEYEFINADALTYAGNLENVRSLEAAPNYRFERVDITDADAVKQLFASGGGMDVVVNFAAESHVDRSIRSGSTFTRTNVLGTQVLLDAARDAAVQKFVQISTDEVYGSLGDPRKQGGQAGLQSPTDTGGPRGIYAGTAFTEESPLLPNSPYAASKAGADCLVRAYHKTYGLPVNITRCSNNYGPYQFPEKLIPLMVIRALSDQTLPVYGDGLNVRDWIHVDDHCAAIDLVLHHGELGEVYNVGSNNEQTNIEMVKAILAELGKPESLIEFVEDRLGHDWRYAIDATKIRTKLGWAPRHDFADGLFDTIRWYVHNEPWWRRVLSGEYRKHCENQSGGPWGGDRDGTGDQEMKRDDSIPADPIGADLEGDGR